MVTITLLVTAIITCSSQDTPRHAQVLVTEKVYDLKALTPTGTSILLRGQLKRAPEKASQAVEVQALGPSRTCFSLKTSASRLC